MRFRLLQARLENDPVRGEERLAFATQLGVDLEQVETFDLLTGEASFERVTTGTDAVLVGGSGAFSVLDDTPWMPSFFRTLEGLVEHDFPTFASCFGFQGIVRALGGEMIHDEDHAEVGSFELRPTSAAAEDPVFRHLPTPFVAQAGHKDRAARLPAGITNLASSERCPYQAFRLGRNVIATQFHPELTHLANMARMKRYFDMYARAFGTREAERMLDAFVDGPEANQLLVRFRDWVDPRRITDTV